jgi:hypothetical protein
MVSRIGAAVVLHTTVPVVVPGCHPAANPAAVGVAGLEPAASRLSEIDSQAVCYRASSQVAPIREGYKDGVNRCPPPSARRYLARSSLGHPDRLSTTTCPPLEDRRRRSASGKPSAWRSSAARTLNLAELSAWDERW